MKAPELHKKSLKYSWVLLMFPFSVFSDQLRGISENCHFFTFTFLNELSLCLDKFTLWTLSTMTNKLRFIHINETGHANVFAGRSDS